MQLYARGPALPTILMAVSSRMDRGWSGAQGSGQPLVSGRCGNRSHGRGGLARFTRPDYAFFSSASWRKTMIVLEPDPLTSATLSNNVTCHKGSNGSLVITPSGGTTPYVINWTGPGGFSSTDEDLVNLSAGL